MTGCWSTPHAGWSRATAVCSRSTVVEPEVLMDGDHTLERCAAVTEQVLRAVFAQLYLQDVLLEGMILKPGMVLPGSGCAVQASVDAVADATLVCLRQAVPAAVAGVAFLSGGQTGATATAHLNAMHRQIRSAESGMPWPLTFSYGRALQYPALPIWAGDELHRAAAQQALLHRAGFNGAARRGQYQASMEAM